MHLLICAKRGAERRGQTLRAAVTLGNEGKRMGKDEASEWALTFEATFMFHIIKGNENSKTSP